MLVTASIDRQYTYKSWLEEHSGIILKVTRSYAQTPSDVADLRQNILLQLRVSLSSHWLVMPNHRHGSTGLA